MINRIKRGAWWLRAFGKAAVWMLGQPWDGGVYPVYAMSGAERVGRQLERSAAGWL